MRSYGDEAEDRGKSCLRLVLSPESISDCLFGVGIYYMSEFSGYPSKIYRFLVHE